MVILQCDKIDLDVGQFSTTLTYSLADIREPDKRNASFSKTLTLPGTKANNKFFEHAFEVDIETQTFNPNLKSKTILSVDGITTFKGALKLRQVNYLLNGEVSYDCNLIGNIADIYQEMGNRRLRDLDLSDYDHVWNKANVEASWSPTLGDGYVYPMVNYGETSDLQTWDVGLFRPAVFAKTILDAIFSEAGYEYTSNFLTSDLFKRLIIPNSQDKLRLTEAQVTERLFNVGRTTAQTFTDVAPLGFGMNAVYDVAQINDDTTAPYFDNDGSFNTIAYSHEPNYNGYNNYIFTADFSWSITTAVTGSYLAAIAPLIYINRSGVITQLASSVTYAGAIVASSGTYTVTGTIEVVAENISVGVGNIVYVVIGHTTYNQYNIFDNATWQITNISFRNSITNNLLNISDDVVVSSTLPDMLQSDFVTGLIRMFNLYVEPDDNNELNLNIEPRDDYYNDTVEDWSAKLATEKKLEIQPMALLNFKRITCKYKDDSDYYNKIYRNEFTRNYGSYLNEIDNDFVNGEYKIETAFAPTPLQGNFENDRIIPAIFEAQSGNPPELSTFGAQPRILYWSGLKNCETWNMRLFSSNDYKTQFPYAGHLDDVQSPKIDLSFGVPQKVYYGANQFISSLSYTDNNLYNVYYKKFFDEITDRDSKMVTGYFWLTPVDIMNLDFRKIYRVNSHYLRLNKIYDYNPVSASLTKCEFIKVVNYDSFVSASEVMNGGIDNVINSREDAPVIDMTTYQDGNVVARPSSTVITGEKNYSGSGLSTWIGGRNNRVHSHSSGVVIHGEDNTVLASSSGVTITGYNNNIGFGTKSIYVQGDRNTVAPGLSKVTLIKTDDYTASESNILVINGIRHYTDEVYYRETGWEYSNNKNLFTLPNQITGLEAQADKIILIKEMIFALDAGGTPYNFANNLKVRYTGGNVVIDIPTSVINSATDYYYQVADINAKIAVGEGLELYSASDAAAGNGLYYYKFIYQVIDKPF